jgi:integrase
MKKRHLSSDELQKLMQWFREMSARPVGTDDWVMGLMIELELRSGMRTDELVGITPRDLDAKNLCVHLTKPSKESETRSCPIPQDLMSRLLVFVEASGIKHNEPLASVLTPVATRKQRAKYFRDRWARIRFKVFGSGFYLGLHAMRHTYAGIIYQASGTNPMIVMRALGHKSLTSTQRYLEQGSDEELKRLIGNSVLGPSKSAARSGRSKPAEE